MEHDETYLLMMAALDDELAVDDRHQMEAHLQVCTDCARQWRALTAIHTLLLQAPALSPAVDFAQRTLAMLPNRTARRWVIAGLYLLLLTMGLVTVSMIAIGVRFVAPALQEPALVRGLALTADRIWLIVATLLGAVGQVIGSLGSVAGQNPAIVGSVFLMVGFVIIWSGVYREMLGLPLSRRATSGQ